MPLVDLREADIAIVWRVRDVNHDSANGSLLVRIVWISHRTSPHP
jgi:hypothetical protein